jgi:hypothetical protein
LFDLEVITPEQNPFVDDHSLLMEHSLLQSDPVQKTSSVDQTQTKGAVGRQWKCL